MSKVLRIKGKNTGRVKVKTPTVDPLISEVVSFPVEGKHIMGVVKKSAGNDSYVVELALPDSKGVLHAIGSECVVTREAMEKTASVIAGDATKMRVWEANLGLDIEGNKAPTPVYAGEEGKSQIIDYRDVFIEGYLSTFVGTTPADRDGDYVMPDAFKDTLAEFKRNAVMLTDHRNSVETLAGSFDKISVNSQGLAVRGRVSNAPNMINVRFKIAEGHLKSLSMGGLFYYANDGRGIEKVMLFEGSLTPVPANQDALFNVRSLTAIDAVKALRFINKG